MPIIILCSVLIIRMIPFYRNMAEVKDKSRHEIIDGLRGFLAFGVFFQHAVTNVFYFHNGYWQITDIKFYRHLGGESVILFFIITSFLYWTKAIEKKGEIDVVSLYRSRIMRLAPMYLFTAFVITIIAFFNTGFHISSLTGFVRDIFSWLTLGLQTTLSVNNYNIVHINAGIHWTLHFEWIFYLLLPIAAVVLKNKQMKYFSIPLFIYIFLAPDRGYWMIFFFGMLAAHIVQKYPKLPWNFTGIKKWVFSLVPIIGIMIVYYMQYKPYSFLQYCVSLIIFLSFVYGNDLFGLLRLPVIRFLGTISYSIYLLHGIVLYAVLHTVNKFQSVNTFTPDFYWYLILISGLLTVVVSAITYRYIEHPALHLIRPRQAETSPGEIEDRVI